MRKEEVEGGKHRKVKRKEEEKKKSEERWKHVNFNKQCF
jgi:hypothetical protein